MIKSVSFPTMKGKNTWIAENLNMDRLDKLLKEGKDILYSSKLVSSN